MRAAARCGRPGPGGGRGRGHIWTRRQPPATSWRRRLQAAAAAGSYAREGGGDLGARTGRIERSRARAWEGGVSEDRGGRHWSVGAQPRANPGLNRGLPASGPARANGRAPLAGGRRGGNWSRESGTLTHVVRRRWGGVGRGPPSLAAGNPRGIFLADLLYGDSLEPGLEANAREGVPLSLQPRPRRPPGMGALRRGSPPLLFPLQSQVCTAREACPLRLGAGLSAAPGGGTTPAAPSTAGLLGGRAPRLRPLAPSTTILPR